MSTADLLLQGRCGNPPYAINSYVTTNKLTIVPIEHNI